MSFKEFIINRFINSETVILDKKKTIKEYDHCLRCGRKLKNPEARKIGYGSTCLKKMQTTTTKKLF